MISLPFKKKSKGKLPKFLTIDIGSNDVKVVAFEVVEREGAYKATVVGVGRQILLPDSTRGGVIIEMGDVTQALMVAIGKAVNGNTKGFTDAIFGVGGNLSIGRMTTVKVVRGKKAPVSEKELAEIMSKVQEASYNQIQNELLTMVGNADADVQMITSATVYTKLDGKYVQDAIGSEGQNLEIAAFNSFTPTYHLNMLGELAEALDLNVVAVGSSMYALSKSLTYSKEEHLDGVIMDIGGEITDVGVIFGGGIVSTNSLDIGGYHFTLEIGRSSDLSLGDAESKKMDYSYGRLPDSDSILLKGYLDNLLDLWLSGLELLFSNFTGVKTFAPNIYLVGGGSLLPDINEVLSKEPWSKSIPFKSPPEFSKLTVEDLIKVTDTTGKVHATGDIVPLALSIVYLESQGYINSHE